MKKFIFLLLLVSGIGMGANAQDCSFEVTNANPSIYGTKVTITVTVEPTFTPDTKEQCEYEVVVKPQGQMRNILDSQSRSVTFLWRGSKWFSNKENVEFSCSVNDNTYNQCNSNSFDASTCFKKR